MLITVATAGGAKIAKEAGTVGKIGQSLNVMRRGSAITSKVDDAAKLADNLADVARSKGDTLSAFGNRESPRPPRPGKDIEVNDGMVHPTDPPTGSSLFGDVNEAPLSGHYHQILKDTPLPKGYEEFADKFKSLPWQYGGKK
jgi:hypothetical protein